MTPTFGLSTRPRLLKKLKPAAFFSEIHVDVHGNGFNKWNFFVCLTHVNHEKKHIVKTSGEAIRYSVGKCVCAISTAGHAPTRNKLFVN